MKVALKEEDCQILKEIREEIESLQKKMGMFLEREQEIMEQIREEKASLIKSIKEYRVKFDGVLRTISRKYSLDISKQWSIDDDLKHFICEEGEENE